MTAMRRWRRGAAAGHPPALALLLAMAGCAEPSDSGVDVVEGADPDDPAAFLFDPDHVIRVEVDIDPDDALALASEENHMLDLLLGEDCLDDPPGISYTWFHADVTVDGELVQDVGIRKKGLIGSLSHEKPGLKIKFDKWIEGQTFHGVERMTLNNSVSDPSLVRQCLGYGLFADAGLASPRCAFATVAANGDDLGVYVHVEDVKKDFLRLHYQRSDGDLYEGVLSDFRDGWTGSFEAKTGDTDPDGAPVLAITEALAAEDDQVVSALEEVMDVDSFMRFWATEVLVAHIDGYAGNTNNFYIYRDPGTDRVTFLPWGIDATFWDNEVWGQDTTEAVLANGVLAWRLFHMEETRDQYLDTLDALLDEIWDEERLLDEVDRMDALVDPYALPDPWRDPSVEALRWFIQGRRATIEEAIAAGPVWDADLRDPPCMVDAGTLEVTFETTWDTLSVPDPLNEGSGAIAGVWDGIDLGPILGGAIAGESDGMAMVGAVGMATPTLAAAALCAFEPTAVTPGTYYLDLGQRVAYYMTYDTASGQDDWVLEAYVADGDLVLEEASAVPGAVIRGSFSGTLLVGDL